MNVRKLAVAFAVAAFMAGGSVFAQAPAHAQGAAPAAAPAHTQAPAPAAAPVHQAAVEEEADEEEAVEEEVAAPAPAPAPVLAAAPVAEIPAPVPVPEAKPAKPETKVEFYGSASYRFRGRLWYASADKIEKDKDGNPIVDKKTGEYDRKDSSASTFDYLNLLGWQFGAKVKVDDQLSLQFQIGNDWNSGESVTWLNNKSPKGNNGSRTATDNLYVHLAYATWNPGPFTLTGGVIPVVSNGTLDLLERSLSTGSYGEAIFETWSSQLNNSLIALKLGVPVVASDGLNVNAEITTSVIDARSQKLIGGLGTTGAAGVDAADSLVTDPANNPTAALLILDVPIAAGAIKFTPEITTVLNRNYNSKLKKSDVEFIGGLAASYKLNSNVTLSLNGAFGTIGNENTFAGKYGNNGSRTGTDTAVTVKYGKADTATASNVVNVNRDPQGKDTVVTTTTEIITTIKDQMTQTDNLYISKGLIIGIGANIKAGPGAFAISLSYGNSYNGADKYTSEATRVVTSKNTVIEEITLDSAGNTKDNTKQPTSVVTAGTPKLIDEKEIDPQTVTNKNDFLIDLRYTWNVHPKFNIAPRWRTYITTYDEGSGHVKLKMENRPEIVLTGSF